MRTVAAAALAGLALASCGGGDADPPARESGRGEPRVAAAAQDPVGSERVDAPTRPQKARTPEAAASKEPAPERGSRDTGGDAPKRDAATQRLLRALEPSTEDAGPPPAADPASRKLWALVQRRVRRSGAAPAPQQAAPTPDAIRRLLRGAQAQQGG